MEGLHQKLLEEARQRVRSGRVSERALAKMCGLSQPHLHNVLKNIRSLSTSSAERLMRALETSVPELLWHYPAAPGGSAHPVPLLSVPIGSGASCSLTSITGYLPFPGRLLRGLTNPLAAYLSPDLVMPSALCAGDLVLLDQNPLLRKYPAGNSIWVVVENGVLRARYVRLIGTKLYLSNQATIGDKKKWEPLRPPGKAVTEIVKARIVWIGRELEPNPACVD